MCLKKVQDLGVWEGDAMSLCQHLKSKGRGHGMAVHERDERKKRSQVSAVTKLAQLEGYLDRE